MKVQKYKSIKVQKYKSIRVLKTENNAKTDLFYKEL